MAESEVVITGIGVVSPIGVGRDPFWAALCAGRSGIGPISLVDGSFLPVRFAAEVRDFDPKPFVANRKSLKVMSRDSQLGMAAAALACRDADIVVGKVDPDRFGVVLGADQICGPLVESEAAYGMCMADGRFDFGLWGTKAMAASFPLGFLRVLPNMIASHVSIAHDARGPNNTIHQAELSGLLAMQEAANVIQRGSADLMLAGGASSQMAMFDFVRRCAMGFLSPRQDDPTKVVRPFDAERSGQIWGEGAAVFVLESRRHAESRGAKVLSRLLGWSAAYGPAAVNGTPEGNGLRRAMRLALERSGLGQPDLDHLNAHGLSTARDDALEAQAIHDVLPAVPVTAPKSYFGNLGAAGGAMELAVSILSLGERIVPATLNYESPDPACPVRVIQREPMPCTSAQAMSISWTPAGQAAAVVLGGPE